MNGFLCVNDAPTLLHAALLYAQAQIPIFPIEPRGKRPLVPRGVYAASTDPARIRAWWTRFPRANIGMPTGRPTGCWVLDVDPRHGGLRSLEHIQEVARPDELETRLQLTGGGGVHLCYAMQEGVDLANTVRFAGYDGLDLRVRGGYIVVAPSRTEDYYRWVNDLPLAPFPAVLLDRWRAHRQHAFEPCWQGKGPPRVRDPLQKWGDGSRESDPEYWLGCALKYGRPGRRHTYALFLAYHLLDDVGFHPSDARAYLVAYAQRVSQQDHAFSTEEALDCLDYVASQRGYGSPTPSW